jgi:sialic acid synthase SpsE
MNTPIEFVAEIGLNHRGDFYLASKMIDAAVEAGATSVKFQTYLTSERVSNTHELFPLLEACQLSTSQLSRLRDQADAAGVGFLSTVFGLKSLEILQSLGISRFKIASFSISDEDLICAAASCGDLIVSTGTATLDEILRLNDLLARNEGKHMLLHCVSSYPAKYEDLNLINVAKISQLTDRPVGFSDHSVGIDAAPAACALGARLIEKHFTLDRNGGGVDDFFSANPQEFRRMVAKCAEVFRMLGESRSSTPYQCEEAIMPFRKYSKVS